jgi:hypothetical protein
MNRKIMENQILLVSKKWRLCIKSSISRFPSVQNISDMSSFFSYCISLYHVNFIYHANMCDLPFMFASRWRSLSMKGRLMKIWPQTSRHNRMKQYKQCWNHFCIRYTGGGNRIISHRIILDPGVDVSSCCVCVPSLWYIKLTGQESLRNMQRRICPEPQGRISPTNHIEQSTENSYLEFSQIMHEILSVTTSTLKFRVKE